MTGFDPQPTLNGKTLALRPLVEDDFQGLLSAASDPLTWAGHPATNRHQPDIFRRYFDFLLTAGGTLIICNAATGTVMGCSRYYTAPDMPGTISIGFTFLNHAYWGGKANFELKTLMLGHAFGQFEAVWFHIDPTNLRSQKATQKLGAQHIYNTELDLSGSQAPWNCYRLTRQDWQTTLITSATRI